MKKLSTLACISLMFIGSLHAQPRTPVSVLKSIDSKTLFNNLLERPMRTCVVMNFDPDVEVYNAYTYESNNGFVTGTNVYEDDEIASVFRAPAEALYMTKIAFVFAYANSNLPANLSKSVNINVYDVNTFGEPQTLIATVSKLLSEIKANVDNETITEVVFPTPVVLPESKRFAVSVNFGNLTWQYPAEMDSLALSSWDVGTDARNFLIKTFGEWYPAEVLVPGLSAILSIYPLVSDDPTCLDPTPVKLSAFTVQKKAGYNQLSWTTASEQNNVGFDLQRSADGVNFSTIATVASLAPSGNSTQSIDYQAMDKQPLKGVNYYRLVQRDKDGRTAISKVISVNSDGITTTSVSLFPNPVHSTLTVRISSSGPQKTDMQILNMQGGVILKKSVTLKPGENSIDLDVQRLQPGSYLLRLSDAELTRTLKFVK